MEDKHFKYQNITRKREAYAREKQKEGSARRLLSNVETKIRTTFIGAISRIEEKFGHLWGLDNDTPSASQVKMRKLWDDLRKEILDHGNNQIRALRKEFDQYDIDWNRYHIDFNGPDKSMFYRED